MTTTMRPRYLHAVRSNLPEMFAYFRRPVTDVIPSGDRYWFISPASYAIRNARDEIALREAESEDLIRFSWEYDNDYRPENSGDPEWGDHDYANEVAKLESGEWEALVCSAQVPAEVCKHCGALLESFDPDNEDHWEAKASLWGIVIDANDRYNYRREIERELAAESDVI